MRKIKIVLVLFSLCLALSACNYKDDNNNTLNSKINTSTATSVSQNSSESSTDQIENTIEKQIQLIADNFKMWEDIDDKTGFSYTVTDLDNNGRLEIISSVCTNTGNYHTNKVWEIDKDFKKLVPCKQSLTDLNEEASMDNKEIIVYYNPESKTYSYIFNNYNKDCATTYFENKHSLTLRDGNINDIIISYKTTIYHSENSSESIYKNSDMAEITKESYENNAAIYYTDCTKMTAHLKWISNEIIQNMGNELLIKNLTDSYNGFSVK